MTETAYVRSDRPLTRRVDGEIVMFHPARGEYFALGDVGSRIWELLERPVSMVQVCERLRAEFSVDEETCRQQVIAFLEELEAAELVERDG